jgi:hypothetical protein
MLEDISYSPVFRDIAYPFERLRPDDISNSPMLVVLEHYFAYRASVQNYPQLS